MMNDSALNEKNLLNNLRNSETYNNYVQNMFSDDKPH